MVRLCKTFFRTVINILSTHPEQAITILSERGRNLLNYDDQSYRVVKHIGIDALKKYFYMQL